MDETNDILMMYLRVSQHMSSLFRTHFGKMHLTFPQALVLNVLGDEGPMPISLLAERTGSANSTVSGIVDRLEKLHLARRERSDDDRRVVQVAATEQFYQMRTQAKTDVHGYFRTLLAPLSEQERDALAQALHRLDAALTAGQQDSVPPTSDSK